MIEFTPTARERFDDYMRRLHVALAGRKSTEAEDVEQSVHEHIEIALSVGAIILAVARLASRRCDCGEDFHRERPGHVQRSSLVSYNTNTPCRPSRQCPKRKGATWAPSR